MLVLIRHAKSSWQYEELEDFERPLNEKGETDIVLMARHIARRIPPPDYFLSSSAERAIETARGLVREMGLPSLMPQPSDELYMASDEDILNVIHQEGRGEVLYICGHNPGISTFVSRMCGKDMRQLPTLGVAVFSRDGAWDTLDWGSESVNMILTPRECKAAGS